MSSDTRPNLYTALLSAMRQMGPVRKDAKNPAFRSSYATLQSILDTIEGPLWDNGLLIVQRFMHEQGNPILVTELAHAASGETIWSAVPIVSKDASDPQKMGSAITYYRRYSLLSLLGLTPEEDDDGNAASQPRSAPQAQRPTPAPSVQPAPVQAATVAFNKFPPQPPYAPVKAFAAEHAMRAAEVQQAAPKPKRSDDELLAIVNNLANDESLIYKAATTYLGRATSVAELNQRDQQLDKLPEQARKDLYNHHHGRLLVPAAPTFASRAG